VTAVVLVGTLGTKGRESAGTGGSVGREAALVAVQAMVAGGDSAYRYRDSNPGFRRERAAS
jgi:hypothetical protein